MPWVMRRARAIVPLLVLAGCDGATKVAPRRPTAQSTTATAMPALPALPPSVVEAPVSYDVEPLLQALEQVVPTRFGDLRARKRLDGRRAVAYEAVRTPFTVALDSGQLRLSTTLTYRARGYYNPPLAPTVSAGCGDERNAPRLRLDVISTVSLDSAWQLRTRTRLASVRPLTATDRDACRVTLLHVDVTDQVVQAVRAVAARQLPRVDRRLARMDVRSRVSTWYAALQRNIRVRDSVWLQLRPEGVAVGDPSLVDGALMLPMRLRASPRFVIGPEPTAGQRPLPALETQPDRIGTLAHVHLQGVLSYATLTSALQGRLAGTSVRRFGQLLRFERFALAPLGDGRIVLTVGVSGTVEGELHLVGTPRIDTLEKMVTVPDLDFDVETDGALVKGVAWVRRDDLRTRLRDAARVSLTPVLTDMQQSATQALDRELADGVHLSGAVHTGRLVDVVVHPAWLVVRAEATGRLALDIDRELAVARTRRARSPDR